MPETKIVENAVVPEDLTAKVDAAKAKKQDEHDEKAAEKAAEKKAAEKEEK